MRADTCNQKHHLKLEDLPGTLPVQVYLIPQNYVFVQSAFENRTEDYFNYYFYSANSIQRL